MSKTTTSPASFTRKASTSQKGAASATPARAATAHAVAKTPTPPPEVPSLHPEAELVPVSVGAAVPLPLASSPVAVASAALKIKVTAGREATGWKMFSSAESGGTVAVVVLRTLLVAVYDMMDPVTTVSLYVMVALAQIQLSSELAATRQAVVSP